jgi:hypothetical protein
MFKIGITYNPSTNLFYSGLNQTAITLAELFLKLGNYDIYFIDTTCNDNNWWNDFPHIQNITLKQIHQISGLDYFIDIDGLVLPEYRRRIANTFNCFFAKFYSVF